MRDVRKLPKANLHLHLTGSMRPDTLAALAERAGIVPPQRFTREDTSWKNSGGALDWRVFQTAYDTARSLVRSADDVGRIVREAAAADAEDGACWVEVQVDPTAYADNLGGIEAVVEAVLTAAADTGSIGVGVVVATSWARSAEHAEIIARTALRYAGRGVVGFGVSNDERRGSAADFRRACRIAGDAGLIVAPHGGLLLGPGHVVDCVRELGAARIGHGLRAAEDPAVLDLLVERGVCLELCPCSYLGMPGFPSYTDIPVRRLYDAGVPIALGTDDPLFMRQSLAEQYQTLRDVFGYDDSALARCAGYSIAASGAPDDVKKHAFAGIGQWLDR